MNFYFPEFSRHDMLSIINELAEIGFSIEPGGYNSFNLIAFVEPDDEDYDEDYTTAFALPASEEAGRTWYYVDGQFLDYEDYCEYESQRTQDANTRELERGTRLGALYGMS